MMWNFFGLNHGKGPHDGASVVIKIFIQHEQLNSYGTKLHNVANVVGFLCVNISNRPKSSYIGQKIPLHRNFWHVTTIEVDRNSTMYACDVVEGIMKLLSIYFVNKNNLTTLLMKSLAYFSVYCVDGIWDQCLNMPWT